MSGLSLTVKRAVFRLSPDLAWRLAAWRDAETGFCVSLARGLADPARLGLDIGGSWGLFSAALAGQVGELHVFEPNPEKARFLKASLRQRAQVHGIALSDAEGDVELHIPNQSSALATIEASNAVRAMPGHGVMVARQRLDALNLGPVGFVKLDVEGHEAAVLAGAEALLRRDHPALLIEIEERHRPGAVAQTLAWLGVLGYSAWMVDGARLLPAAGFDQARHQGAPPETGYQGSGYVHDFLFLPVSGQAAQRARLAALGITLPPA